MESPFVLQLPFSTVVSLWRDVKQAILKGINRASNMAVFVAARRSYPAEEPLPFFGAVLRRSDAWAQDRP